ncbi:hypothetical protein EPO15_15260 [bacterium]|nr:MAG: hypothetical protein EPO15_15260 [bacterium]
MRALWAAALAVLLAAPRAGAITLDGDGDDTSSGTHQREAANPRAGKDFTEKFNKKKYPPKEEQAIQGILGGFGPAAGKKIQQNLEVVPDGHPNLTTIEFEASLRHEESTKLDRDGNTVRNPGAEVGSSQGGGGIVAGVGQSILNPLAWNPASAPELAVDRTYLEAQRVQDPSHPRVNFALAVQDQARGDNRAALSGYETALAGGQDDSRTLTFASLSALNAGDPRKAAQWASQALEKDPNGPMAEQAEAISKMALKRLPKEEDPFKNRPPTRAPQSDATSVPELDQPLPPKPADPGLPPEVAKLLADTNRLVAQASKAYRAGDNKEAEKLATEALAKDPEDVRALQLRAAAEAKEGRWEEAQKDATRGLDLAPGYVPLLLLRAAAGTHLKDWRSVRADASQVLAKEKTNPTAWRFMGLAQAGLGERADAVASLSQAVRYGDRDAARLLAAAQALPPGSDGADLIATLGASVTAERPAPAAPAGGRSKPLLVLGAALFAGLVAGAVILLAGRRDSEPS